MPTDEQNKLAQEVIELLQSDAPGPEELEKAKRLMRDWPEDMDFLKAGLYETINRIEDDTL